MLRPPTPTAAPSARPARSRRLSRPAPDLVEYGWTASCPTRRIKSEALFRELRRLDPTAPISAYRGRWAHSSEMRARALLSFALEDFGLLPDGGRLPASVRHMGSALGDSVKVRRHVGRRRRPGRGVDRIGDPSTKTGARAGAHRGTVPCALESRPHRASPAEIRQALRSRRDVWGDGLLAAPGGPTLRAGQRRYLAPILLARAPGSLAAHRVGIPLPAVRAPARRRRHVGRRPFTLRTVARSSPGTSVDGCSPCSSASVIVSDTARVGSRLGLPSPRPRDGSRFSRRRTSTRSGTRYVSGILRRRGSEVQTGSFSFVRLYRRRPLRRAPPRCRSASTRARARPASATVRVGRSTSLGRTRPPSSPHSSSRPRDDACRRPSSRTGRHGWPRAAQIRVPEQRVRN